MTHLKPLSFTAVPKGAAVNPILMRRGKLIARLEDQRTLAKDPTFAPTVLRWVKASDGTKQRVETQKPLRPIDTLIAAVRAGELDEVLAQQGRARGVPKAKRAA